MSARAPETPGQVELRLRIERKCAELGRVIAKQCPPGFGFALLMFEFGDRGAMAYMSNGKRPDVARAMEEWLETVHAHDLAAENQRLREELDALKARKGGA